MKLSPAGRRVIKHRDGKNPLKVERGKESAAERIERGWDPVVRSSHLGYDCYATGMINSSGQIRIILRPRRLPPHIPADLVTLLPIEMWWPAKDHAAAHACIDAVLKHEIGVLRTWISNWPDHTFGFELYLETIERRAVGLRNAMPEVSPRSTINPDLPATAGKSLPAQFSLFPAEVVAMEPLYKADGEGHQVRVRMARFADHTSALCIDINAVFADGTRLLCSRAYMHPVTSKFEVVQHYPGRLKGLGLPLDLIYHYLGPKARHGTAASRPYRRGAPSGPPKVRTSPNESATMLEARHVQAVLATGGPTTERYRDAPVHDQPEAEFEPEAFPLPPSAPA
jgi:hypothetical protein